MARSPRETRVVPRGLPFPTGHSYCVIEEPSRRILGLSRVAFLSSANAALVRHPGCRLLQQLQVPYGRNRPASLDFDCCFSPARRHQTHLFHFCCPLNLSEEQWRFFETELSPCFWNHWLIPYLLGQGALAQVSPDPSTTKRHSKLPASPVADVTEFSYDISANSYRGARRDTYFAR
jgi:hypothetical protein